MGVREQDGHMGNQMGMSQDQRPQRGFGRRLDRVAVGMRGQESESRGPQGLGVRAGVWKA